MGASDIHVEPYESYMRIRLRIDGVLQEIARPPAHMKAAVASRFKVMAGLKIEEKRLPQDGNINATIENKPIDFRINTLPTVHGEKIVLRILDKSSLQVDMTKLGFEQSDLNRFKDSIHKPFGMVLVTGPTGSGKTTTLYSALADLNQISDNIMTAEDPVEFTLEGVNQVHVKPEIGLTFADALKAFLRQDPDIVMVGEIRDRETGEIAIKAALTGHMVLSTLHTNSAADTVVRLQNMGLESFNLISALQCIVAQRLARRICVKCREPDPSLKPEYLVSLGVPPDVAAKSTAYKGRGCDHCNKSGYKGRTAIHEVMVINDDLREAIMKGAPAMTLKKIAMASGMRTLRQNALLKMLKGETDALEVVANTAADDDNTDSSAA
jgi:type IV pilus assembly protein PilB